ncbi:unnamed protein product [Sphagnum jensenii]|uniref:Thioredoxin domain-containing protein n=1 Tax=Sphagnum jensenii TaxID=128206 RepID=A0ABP1A4Z2_9BRYO
MANITDEGISNKHYFSNIYIACSCCNDKIVNNLIVSSSNIMFCPSQRRCDAYLSLLNAAEYRKRKAEQKEEEDENDEDDDELCPVECVREFKTNSELQSILQHAKLTNTLVVVDFYRTACGSCRYIEKGFIKLCKGAGNGAVSVIFLKHNVMDEYEEQSEVAEKYNIRVVPLFHFYKDEELVESFPTRDKAKISDAIYKHIGKSEIIEEWSDLTGSK